MAKPDDIMPDPQVFPVCSQEGCGSAWVLRRGHIFDGKKWVEGWAWMRDCKHKKAEAKMTDLRKRTRVRKNSSTGRDA